jgi:zinc protease
MSREAAPNTSTSKRTPNPRMDLVKVVTPLGSTLVTRENHATPIVSFCVYFPGGVLHETRENHGITSLMQRLLIKGTRKRTAREMADELEFMGAYLSPFTGKESLGVSMSAVSRHFYRGVEIFADCIMHPRFDEDEFERERRNLIMEIEKRKDDMLNHCLEMCEEGLFGANPYGANLIGSKESLGKLKRSDIVHWHHAFYAPERMVLSLVGDTKTEEVHKRFAEVFEHFRHYDVVPPPEFQMTPVMEKKMVTEKREKRQVAISLGFLAPALISAEYFPFKVLDYLLSGMGSRLFINLRDIQGLAYVVNSSYSARTQFGSFKAYMQTSADKRERALEGLIHELEEVKRSIPSDEEVERVKNYMLGLHEIAMQKKWSQASKLAFYELVGLGYEFLEEYPEGVRKVTAAQVQKVAEHYLDTSRATCAMITPKD